MRFEERELNECEIFLAEIDRVKALGKRISTVFMTPSEFDSFYQVAMNSLPAPDTASLMNRKFVLGVQIVIEEPTKKKKG